MPGGGGIHSLGSTGDRQPPRLPSAARRGVRGDVVARAARDRGASVWTSRSRVRRRSRRCSRSGWAAFPAPQRVPARRGHELPGAVHAVLRAVPRIRGCRIWLGGSRTAIDGLIRIVNGYIPGIISDTGLIKREQVEAVAQESGKLLGVTGSVAGVVVIWTAIGFVTFTRRAVRDTFGLPLRRAQLPAAEGARLRRPRCCSVWLSSSARCSVRSRPVRSTSSSG